MFYRFLIQFGFFLAVIFSPLLFGLWFWSERRVTTRQLGTLCGVLAVAGLLMGISVIALLAGLVLIAIGVAWLWHAVILSDFTYSRSVSPTHVFPGDFADVTWTLNNAKPLPVSWLRWREVLPGARFGSREGDGLEFPDSDAKTHGLDAERTLDQVSALRSYETMTHRARVRAVRRGYYRFWPATCQASDALGMYKAERVFDDDCVLTVYPRIRQTDALELEVRGLLGDWRRRNSLVEDPVWFRGDRDYRSTDSMRSIDWSSSARTSTLQVKTFEPTTHPKLMLLVNLHAFERISTGWITQYMEDVISTAASVAAWALELGYEVGVHSNGALPGAHVPFRVLPSAGENQLFSILDYLAKISLVVNRQIEDTMADVRDLPYGTAVIICTNVVTPGLMNSLDHSWRGRDVALLLVNNKTPLEIPGVRIMRFETETDAA